VMGRVGLSVVRRDGGRRGGVKESQLVRVWDESICFQ